MNSSSKKPSYTQKNVFIGIDVHKRTYSIVSVVEGIVVKKWQTAAVPEQLARQLGSYFPEANLYSAYEAGFSGFVLHRRLEEAGIKLTVSPERVTTDGHSAYPRVMFHTLESEALPQSLDKKPSGLLPTACPRCIAGTPALNYAQLNF